MRRGVGQPVKEEQTLKATTDTSWILAEPACIWKTAQMLRPQKPGQVVLETWSVPDQTNAQTSDKRSLEKQQLEKWINQAV